MSQADYMTGEYDPAQFWNEHGREKAKWEDDQPDAPEIRQMWVRIIDAVSSVLELGCGPGRNLRELGGDLYIGVDISLAYLQRARARLALFGINGIVFQADIANPLPFLDSQFDLVFADSTLQHVPPDKIERTIAEAFRVSSRYVCCIEYTEPDEGSDFFQQIHLFQHDYAALAEPYGTLVWHADIQAKVQPARKEVFLWEKR
jgi:SAM-dependent methyltransferase